MELRANKTRASVLVADDDDGVRELLTVVLGDARDVGSVIAVGDGAEALQLGLQLRPEIAVLDLHMPRLDGVAVAVTLRELVPSMRVAVQSSDMTGLRALGGELGVALFDKDDLDAIVAWVTAQAAAITAAGRVAYR
jgi:CheY-like chemotaxis protein